MILNTTVCIHYVSLYLYINFVLCFASINNVTAIKKISKTGRQVQRIQ